MNIFFKGFVAVQFWTNSINFHIQRLLADMLQIDSWAFDNSGYEILQQNYLEKLSNGN